MVNDQRPQANGPFLVYPVPDFPRADGNTEYKGFFIMMSIDTCFIDMDDEVTWYSAKVISGTQILVQAPAWPVCLWPKGPRSTFLYDAIVRQLGTQVRKSLHNAHSVFDDVDADSATIEARKWKYFLLDFSGVKGIGELCSKVLYSDAGEAEVLDFNLVSLPRTWNTDSNGNKTVTSEENYIGFRVANVEAAGGRKVARTGVKKSKLALKRNANMGNTGSI